MEWLGAIPPLAHKSTMSEWACIMQRNSLVCSSSILFESTLNHC